jgi:hypothetical protein
VLPCSQGSHWNRKKQREMDVVNRSPSAAGVNARQAFRDQAGYCEKLGSPFTALLCRVLADGLDCSRDTERYILEWPGDAGAFADSVPLRVAGALHYLVRAGRVPELAELYPPKSTADPAALLASACAVLQNQGSFVREFLQSPPQTNEVGRSAALIAGCLDIAARTQRPLSLFELGSSAGLNLIADRYSYQFGALRWTPRSAAGVAREQSPGLALTCAWEGPEPPIRAPLDIRSRRGCDRHPLNTADPAQRARLLAYVWPDQPERIERLSGAIRTMLSAPVVVEAADAVEWIQAALPTNGEPGITRVVFHSIFWSYLDRISQDRIATHLARIGGAASADAPLAWLRFELAGQGEPVALRLTLWPGGQDELLARAHPHGAWVHWSD